MEREEAEAIEKQIEEEEAAAAARREARVAKGATLPAEPESKAESSHVVVKLPDGRRLNRRFEKSCALQARAPLVHPASCRRADRAPDAHLPYMAGGCRLGRIVRSRDVRRVRFRPTQQLP